MQSYLVRFCNAQIHLEEGELLLVCYKDCNSLVTAEQYDFLIKLSGCAR